MRNTIRWIFILSRLIDKIRSLGINSQTASPIYWYWDGNGDIGVAIVWGFKLFNLTEEEIEGFATTSCGPDLWVLRALGHNRLGLSVPFVDKVYYSYLEFARFCRKGGSIQFKMQ